MLKEKLGHAGIADTELGDLEALFKAGDPVVTEWIDDAAAHLAPMIAMLENILDPQTVILGGALPEVIISDIIQRMGDLPTSVASRRQRELPRVMHGKSGQLTAALGAAALPLFDIVTPKLETSPGAATQAPG